MSDIGLRPRLTKILPRVSGGWSIPRQQTVSEWAAANRRLQDKESAEPGPWSNRRAPYLTAIMDAFGDPDVATVVVMKAAQVGMSEAWRNVVGYWIAQDPGPLLWVMPGETEAEEMLEQKIAPMIRATAVCAAHVTTRKHDISRRQILLDHMEIHNAWATSPSSLASRPRRYALCDEVDKYPAWAGKEADPIALAEKRLTTFGHRAKLGLGSTPTTRTGKIYRAWEASPVRLRFHLPCPHCGEYAAPSWSQVRWPQDLPGTRAEQAAAIAEGGLAWYDCGRCGARIEERARSAMIARGVWAADDHETVAPDGALVGQRPDARRLAFHVPALISPWVSWSQMASEFVAAIGDESMMMDWRNSRLAEPYEVRAGGIKSDAFDKLVAAGHRPGVLPSWTVALLATADTQKDHFWYVVRAWGIGRSRLIAAGRCETFDELRALTLGTVYPGESKDVRPMPCAMLGIDSGGGGDLESDMSRTHQVYQFALTDPARIVATKGWGGVRELDTPVRQSYVAFNPPGGKAPTQVALYHLRTGYFKDVLAARIAGEEGADPWEVHAAIDQTYRRQMASEHKIIMRRGKAQVARWVVVSAGAANHLWDCESMQGALAQIAHVDTPRPPRRQYGVIKQIGE